MSNNHKLARVLFWTAIAAMLVVAFDHGMKVKQAQECMCTDEIPCPSGLWIWETER